MRVQAQQILKNSDVSGLLEVAAKLIDTIMTGSGEENMDDVYEIVFVRTPQPRQSPLAVAVGLPALVE